MNAEGVMDATLRFDAIPVERHWAVSLRLHDALGHTEPWEICDGGCDRLASDAILLLFGRVAVPAVSSEEGQ